MDAKDSKDELRRAWLAFKLEFAHALRRLWLALRGLNVGASGADVSEDRARRIRALLQSLPPREISREEFDDAMCGKGGAP